MSVKQYLDWKKQNDPEWGIGKRLLGDALLALGPFGLIGVPWLLAESYADRKKAEALNPPPPPPPKPESPRRKRKRLAREKAAEIALAKQIRDPIERAHALAYIEEDYRNKGLS